MARVNFLCMFVFRKSREAQRKATHNEGKLNIDKEYCDIKVRNFSFCLIVERRRRDRINELIKMLAMIVPGCQKKDATTGTVVGVSQTQTQN